MFGAAVLRRRRVRRDEEASLTRRHQLRILRDASNPFEANASTFMGKYRLSPEMALYLVNMIRVHLTGGSKSFAIPPEIKVLAALHFLAHGSDQKSIAGEYDISMSQPSLCRCIKEVTEALNEAGILKTWVKFPNGEEVRRLLVRHYELFSLPGVLGFVDGTHVNIRKPIDHEEIYVNRKFQHSLNVQIACDADLRIINILARYPGSSHNSFIWGNSALRAAMQDLFENWGECWLLGDSGYPCEPWLLTPILNAPNGSQEALYTSRHIKARNCIERCIGVLKGRFRCISKHRTLEYEPVKAGKIINACAVLHNMCLSANLPVVDVQDSEAEHDYDNVTTPASPAELARAMEVRRNIVQRMPHGAI